MPSCETPKKSSSWFAHAHAHARSWVQVWARHQKQCFHLSSHLGRKKAAGVGGYVLLFFVGWLVVLTGWLRSTADV